MLAAAMGVMVGMRNAVALTPTPAWVAGRFLRHRAGQALLVCSG